VGRRHADGGDDAPEAAYIRRNGLARSEKATVREHFIPQRDVNHRHDRDHLTDPVYLTEPYIKSRNFVARPRLPHDAIPCSVDIEVDRPQEQNPALHLPGTNSFISEAAAKRKMPLEPRRGGAETMYPEYIDKMKTDADAQRCPAADASELPRAGTARSAMTRPRIAVAVVGSVSMASLSRSPRHPPHQPTARTSYGGASVLARPAQYPRGVRAGAATARSAWATRGCSSSDTMNGAAAPDLIAAITTGQPEADPLDRQHAQIHADHTGGNAAVREIGSLHRDRNTRAVERRINSRVRERHDVRLTGSASSGDAAPERAGRPTASSCGRRTCSSTAKPVRSSTCPARTPTATPSSSSDVRRDRRRRRLHARDRIRHRRRRGWQHQRRHRRAQLSDSSSRSREFNEEGGTMIVPRTRPHLR
jgi:hypothetical protein